MLEVKLFREHGPPAGNALKAPEYVLPGGRVAAYVY